TRHSVRNVCRGCRGQRTSGQNARGARQCRSASIGVQGALSDQLSDCAWRIPKAGLCLDEQI
ncbi:hypothetical protein LPJ75_002526, partial [Coemansia sp. RSA 2598]